MLLFFQRLAGDLSKVLRWAVPWVATGLCIWLLTRQFPGILSVDILAQLLATPLQNWVLAGLATWVSFWALGRYDAIAHRQLGTGVTETHARFAGKVAIAFSQTVGFGVVTGAFARWRMVPGLSALVSVQLTVFVAVSFLAALGTIISAVVLAHVNWLLAIVFVLCLAAAIGCTLFYVREVQLFRRRVPLPTIPTAFSVAAWTMVDIVAAGTALFLLMPEDSVSYSDLLLAYVVALGIAIASGAPGGVGPFELALLALLPGHDATALAVGIVCFRLIYFAVPALIAGLCLLAPPRKSKLQQHGVETAPLQAFRFPVAETRVVIQSGGRMIKGNGTSVAIAERGQSCLGLFDPAEPRPENAFELLQDAALIGNRVPCFYKVSQRIAVLARQRGWQVVKVAEDARVTPATFTISGSKKRQLRRKLRNAEVAGVSVSLGCRPDDLPRLWQIDQAWQKLNGGARGLTTGRFSTRYLSRQIVLTARRDDQVEAFISLHATAKEWAVDLMRAGPLCPDGTMHALVAAAIQAAKDQNIARFSLAACPTHPLTKKSGAGLLQFKTCFAPQWKPLYMVAPTWGDMGLAALDILHAVHHPDPLPGQDRAPSANSVQVDDENYEIASNISA